MTQTQLTPAPTGITGHVLLDCSATPYDLRPALTICKKVIENAEKKLSVGQKFIPILGDHHNLPTHRLLQAGITVELHKSFGDRFLVTLEIPHNLTPPSNHPAAKLNIRHRALYAPYTKAYLFNLLHTQNIATCFNDTAMVITNHEKLYKEQECEEQPHKEQSYINQLDQETKAFIQKNFPKLAVNTPTLLQEIQRKKIPAWFGKNNILMSSFDGMTIRNKFMVHHALKKAYSDRHDIILLTTGQVHVFGGNNEESINYPYNQSICSDFSGKNTTETNPYITLPIIPLSNQKDQDEKIIEKAKKHSGPVLFIKGISNESHQRDADFALSNAKNVASLEQKFAEKVWRASGSNSSNLPKPELFSHYVSKAKYAMDLNF